MMKNTQFFSPLILFADKFINLNRLDGGWSEQIRILWSSCPVSISISALKKSTKFQRNTLSNYLNIFFLQLSCFLRFENFPKSLLQPSPHQSVGGHGREDWRNKIAKRTVGQIHEFFRIWSVLVLFLQILFLIQTFV